MNMINDRDGLYVYRLLEFPNESAQSWPIARDARDDHRRVRVRERYDDLLAPEPD